jgi:hypothetical protein
MNEKCMTMERYSGIMNLLLGKVEILKIDKDINNKTDEGNIKAKIVILNKIAYMKLVLFMNVKFIIGNVAFKMVEGSKSN